MQTRASLAARNLFQDRKSSLILRGKIGLPANIVFSKGLVKFLTIHVDRLTIVPKVLSNISTEFQANQPWTINTSSTIDGGHSVLVGGYTLDVQFVTWIEAISLT